MDKVADFDAHAIEYDQWYERHDVEYALELEALRMLVPATGQGVEIGAGTGRFTAPLDVSLGIEPSAAMSDIARQRGVNMIEGRAESLPLADSQYDYALFVMTVCFLDDPLIAFREVNRVLKDDAVIIIGFVDRLSTLGQQYDARKGTSIFYRGASFYSLDEMLAMLEMCGFVDARLVQAVLPADLSGEEDPCVKAGHGQGSFVVLRAVKSIASA